MKNMLYGIGLLISGSIGVGTCLIAANQSQSTNIVNQIFDSNIIVPIFLVFAVLTAIGIIVSTKEFFDK